MLTMANLLNPAESETAEIDLGACGDMLGGGGKLVKSEIGVMACALSPA